MSRTNWRTAEQVAELPGIKADLFEAQNGICSGCGGELPPPGERPLDPRERLTIDHTVSRFHHGPDQPGNRTVMHGDCNSYKANSRPTGCELIHLLAVNARMGVFPQDGTRLVRLVKWLCYGVPR